MGKQQRKQHWRMMLWGRPRHLHQKARPGPSGRRGDLQHDGRNPALYGRCPRRFIHTPITKFKSVFCINVEYIHDPRVYFYDTVFRPSRWSLKPSQKINNPGESFQLSSINTWGLMMKARVRVNLKTRFQLALLYRNSSE